ncbi:MAG: hypothetical protein ACRELY_01515 [Polyangiaceae bacterium]
MINTLVSRVRERGFAGKIGHRLHFAGGSIQSTRVSLVKRLLFVAIGAFVWLFAPSAFAAAPQCDVRAATTLAPPPTLEDLRSSVDLGDACVPSVPLDVVHQGRGSSEVGFSASPDVALIAITVVPSASRSDVLPRVDETSRAPSGVRSSVDRPPRA